MDKVTTANKPDKSTIEHQPLLVDKTDFKH